MATKKPTAPAKSNSKPAAKSAPAKSATKAKAAPAPAPEPETEEVELAEGMQIRFLGYGADVPEDQQILVADEIYTIHSLSEPEGDDPGGIPLVAVDNPDFDKKKKESDDNPKQILIDVMPEEFEVVEEDGEAAEEAGAEEGEAEEAAEEVPPPAKGKGKAAAAPAPAPAAKGKAVGKAKAEKAAEPEAEEAAAEDTDTPDLETEDAEVIALIEANQGRLIDVAQELESQTAVNEFRLGGILYHIKKDRAYLEVENGEELYGDAVKQGFGKFISDYFNLEYRKAMHLIKIYVAFSLAGIEDSASAVARMGWSKAAKIAPHMLETPDSANDLIDLATESTVNELSEAIQQQTTVGGKSSGGARVTKTVLKFKLLEEEGKTALTVLEGTQQAMGHKDLADTLVYILTDWAANNGVEVAAPAKAAPKQTKAVGKTAPAAKSAPAAKRVAKAAA